MKRHFVLLLFLALATTSLGVGASQAQSQQQQQWQLVIERLQRMETEIAALRASGVGSVGGTRASGELSPTLAPDALLRLASIETLLREQAGALETLTFRLQQLQQSSAAYRRDVELRFQILEDDLAAAVASAAREAPRASGGVGASGAFGTFSAPSTAGAAGAAGTTPDVSGTVRATTPTRAFATPGSLSLSTGAQGSLAATPSFNDRRTPANSVVDESLAADANPNDFLLEDNAFASLEPAPEPIDVPAATFSLPPDEGISPDLVPKPLGVIPLEAELPQIEDPNSLYQNSYALLEGSDFASAQEGFERFVAAYPDHTFAADAHYWIGEIFYVQGDYVDAAETFLHAMQTYDASTPRAGDTMLKLAITLRLLEQPERACAAFDELLFSGKFGNISKTVRRRAELERQLAGC